MKTENSKTNESNKFIYQFTDKSNFKTLNNKYIGFVNLSIYYTWKKLNLHTTTINLKYLLPLRMMNFNYLMVLIQFQTFRITLNLSSKNTKITENPPLQIYPNKIKNKIVFKIKTVYKLELLSSETMTLLGSEVLKSLVHCNLVNNSYQKSY